MSNYFSKYIDPNGLSCPESYSNLRMKLSALIPTAMQLTSAVLINRARTEINTVPPEGYLFSQMTD
jgi:hypothetical protein